MKYTKFQFDLSRFDISDDDYQYVKLPHESNGKKKVLFVLDMMPTEDLESGRLLSGVTGDLLHSLIQNTKRFYAKQAPSFSWLACTYNAFRTFGKSSEFRAQAAEAFKDRLNHLILKYQPDYIVAFGTGPMEALLGDKLVKDGKDRTRYSYWLGVPVQRTFKVGKAKHTAEVVSTISLNTIVRGDGAEASLLGYMCRNLSAIYGKHYAVDSGVLDGHKSIVIDSYKKFDRLMDTLCQKPYVSIDTEAKNLHKVTNRLLTIQFAYSQEKGFLVPVSHKDSPFTPKEIRKIKSRMKEYLEGANDNEYHIYTNAKFDLTLFRSECDVEYFANPVWDILGGEFALDENLKFLDTALGEYYYSLGNVAVQYGFEGYIHAEFGKQHRKNFENADLNDPATIKYTTLDVVVPLAIHLQQLARGQAIGYKSYKDVVLNEISDTIHSFSKMEHTGAGLDVEYLFYLRTKDSPIEQEINKMLGQLLATDAVKKANRLISKEAGVPTESLWGDQYQAPLAFALNKPDHKKLLFFKVLGLEPLDKGKSGVGKLDKNFQSHYKHVPEVAQFTALEKAKKLKNAYVKSFINMLGESEDLQKDHRIRPNFGYLTVVTHRTSARDPNLQQVPTHSALGKHIKRLFVARFGTLYIKVDYRVHEVRGWGLIAFDKAVAGVFATAKALRDAFRLKPSKELGKRVKLEADVHVQNASYFFGVPVEEVGKDKALRNSVKAVIFGLIYQKSVKNLAADLGKEVEFMEKLVAAFMKRFPKGMKWIESIKKFARENCFVEAPNKIRRNLWGYLLPESHDNYRGICNRNDRQAVNSPIQGMCSKFMMNGIRVLDRAIFKLRQTRKDFELWISNSVHDSLETEAGYSSFIKSLAMIEWALTEGVKKTVKKRYGFELVSDLEIDFEIGATLSEADGWDFSVPQLETMVMDSLLFQRNKLGYAINPDKVMREQIFSEKAMTEDAPQWMKEQIKNLDYTFELSELRYIKQLHAKGLACQDAGNKMLADAKKVKNEEEQKAIIKTAEGSLSEGEDLIKYAKELNTFRKHFKPKLLPREK